MLRAGIALGLGILLSLTGCKSANDDTAPTQTTPTQNNPIPVTGATGGTNVGGGSGATVSGIALELVGAPTISWKATNGKTTIVSQFAVRDQNGVPVQDPNYKVEMLINDETLDVESLLEKSAQDLAVNLYFSMVLDASYSMTQHTPPAFEPMKEAARSSYQAVLDAWAQRPGDVKFSLLWFAELLNQNAYNANTNRDWRPDDILSIPTPVSGESTKLLAAVRTMGQYLTAEKDRGVFAGARDQYVMLVFSDGKDNYSWFDNSNKEGSLSTTSGALYRQFGAPSTDMTQVKAAIAANPKLTVHVIGLGDKINREELQEIATAGGGLFLENPSSVNIGQLFDRVMREFLTIQTRGAEIPLPPNEYKFTLRVSNLAGDIKAEKSYKIRAGDAQSGIISNID